MWTNLVVMLPPFFDQHLRLGARTKQFEAQALVAKLALEVLCDAILPRLARFDQCGTDALCDDPGQQRFGDEFRPIVAAQEPRSAARAHQPRATSCQPPLPPTASRSTSGLT